MDPEAWATRALHCSTTTRQSAAHFLQWRKMKVTGQYGTRFATRSLLEALRKPATPSLEHQRSLSPTLRGWTCPTCQSRTHSTTPVSRLLWKGTAVGRRHLSVSRRLNDEKKETSNSTEESHASQQPSGSFGERAAHPASLPSQTELRRSQISKRASQMMDELLARASVAGQHINAYTGTDYSGIEALRTEIAGQEQRVRDCHKAVESARASHHEAHARQASAQKEIVGLLERKSSWSPTDLETYMSRVRSEHANEQAVQAAKDGLAAAERQLEDARSLLERLERKQYHEEQIWSDTIRRNSTWVTFGLMGLNIVLLLAQITIFEPYRRRKIVRDVQHALDEKTVAAPPLRIEDDADEDEDLSVEESENATDRSDQALANYQYQLLLLAESNKKRLLMARQGMEEEHAAHAADAALEPTPSQEIDPNAQASDFSETSDRQRLEPSTWSDKVDAYKEGIKDLFSERTIEVKKVEVTTKALEGAATGVVVMGLIVAILRAK